MRIDGPSAASQPDRGRDAGGARTLRTALTLHPSSFILHPSDVWPLAAALGFAALFCFQRISDMDTGWLLALGRRVAEGPFPNTNAISWTAPDYPWYPTNWLFDLALWQSNRLAGAAGVQTFAFLLAAAALAMAWAAARRAGAGPAAASAAVLAAMGVLWTRLVPRPHLVQLVLEALVLERCAAARVRRDARPLFVLPPVFAAWMNAHQSAPMGLALAGLAMAPALLGREGWPVRARIHAAIALGAGLPALLATPGFDAPLRDLFAHLSLGSVLPLQEHRLPDPLGEPYLFAMGALVAAAAATRAGRPWVAPVLLHLALTFGLGRRFGGDLALVGAVPLALALEAIVAPARPVRSLAAGAAALATALVLMIAGRVPLLELGSLLGSRWDERTLPVEAVERARRLGLGPRGFHAYRFGGYVAFRMPEAGDFQDGRVRAWPPEFWHELAAACETPQAFAAYLDRAGVGWALVSATPAPLSGHGLLGGAPGWRLVHADPVAELYVRGP